MGYTKKIKNIVNLQLIHDLFTTKQTKNSKNGSTSLLFHQNCAF